MTRTERAARAAAMRRAGMMHKDIAAVLGISTHYVSGLLADPDGTKTRARKNSYRKPCPSCGRLMDGSGGPNTSPKSCRYCAGPNAKIWTAETIIESFQAFHRLTGRSPTAADAMGRNPSIRRKLSPERLAEIDAGHELIYLPHPGSVKPVYGGWREAVRAAGLEPAPSGGPSHRGRRKPT